MLLLGWGLKRGANRDAWFPLGASSAGQIE
jgi:hypothetical protein